jgi:hypothetical protein
MSHSAMTIALTAPTSQPTTTGLFSTCSGSSGGSFAQMHAQDAAMRTDLPSKHWAPLSCNSSAHCTPFLPSRTCWPPSPASHRSRRACCWRRQPRGGLQQQGARRRRRQRRSVGAAAQKGVPVRPGGNRRIVHMLCTCVQCVATTQTEQDRAWCPF